MALSLRGVKTRYEVREVIARGGMGVVYKAYDKVMKRAVALKTLLDLTDSKALELFHKECEDLASLIHPNIVEIFDVGELEDENGTKPYLVMPFLPGVTLDKLIRSSSSRLKVERCVDIFCQICRGLHAAHERGLIHRDLKPSNVFVMDDDSVKIIDFGVAHRVDTSQTIGRKGTLIYMSPEQIALKPLTAASDIFSLGTLCYEALTRRRPFERPTESEIADAIALCVPPPVHELNPSVSLALSQSIHKAMAKNPHHRYRSAREFGEILQRALHNEPIELFNPARIRPRLERAQEAYDKGDYEFGSEIIGELEAEGHLDPAITQLREDIDRSRVNRRVGQLIETAKSRVDEKEYQIALQKIDEALQLDPKNTVALALKARVDSRRTDQDIEGWLNLARTHVGNRAFGQARDALRRILELRPRESKAAQLLSEVERLEQNQQRLRAEKEGLYKAAVDAERNGDISSAVSKLERVLEIDKQSSEPSRTGTYQRHYEKVRSQYESVKAARAEAKRLLDDQKFAQALATCNENLAKYPGDTLFQALKFDVQEKHRQAVSGRIAETDKRVEAEPDLDRRVSILEEAVSENPGEAHFERALKDARDKRDMVGAIVARARGSEERGQFDEALAQWEILQKIYSRYPGLNVEIERLNKRREQSRRQEAKAKWVEQIDRHLEDGDFIRAGDLGRMAEQEFPGDPEFSELQRVAQQGLERHAEAQRLLALGQEACMAGSFSEGVEAIRRAYDLDGNNGQIRNVLVETLVEQGRRLMETDPRSAEDLLNQALELEPDQALATGLLRLFADQRKVGTIDRALAQARRLQAENELKQALDIIAEALATYPKEQRLIQVQTSLRRLMQESRRRDLEQAKRMAREAESAELGSQQRTEYGDRLDRYMTDYADDEEFRTVVQDVRRRLQTASDVRGTQEVPSPVAIDNTGGAPQGRSGQSEAVIPPVRRKRISFGSKLAKARGRLGKQLGSTWSSLRERIVAFRLPAQPWSRNSLLIATAVFVGIAIGLALIVQVTKRHKPTPVPLAEGTIAISTSPSGAEIYVDGKRAGITSSPFPLQHTPGIVDLEFRLPGYQTLPEQLTVRPGSNESKTFTLVPTDPVLRISGAGRVTLNDEFPEDLKEGEFEQALKVGDHSVKIDMSSHSWMSFKVHVDVVGLPVISELKAVEMTPLIASSFGEHTKVYWASKTPVPIQVDGIAVGNVGPEGLELAPLAANSHELTIGDGKDIKKHTINVDPARIITVILEADPNAGRLMVKANEDDVTVVVTYNGNKISGRVTKNHQAFFNLRAHSYVIQASKDGYVAVPSDQTVEISKGEDKTVSFELRAKPKSGTIRVQTTALAEISMDRKPPSTADANGVYSILNVPPGEEHTIEARLTHYQSRSTKVRIEDGEQKPVDLTLTRAPGTVQITGLPQGATVTYKKKNEPEHTAPSNSFGLPEGDYDFTGKVDGYNDRTTSGLVRSDETTKIDLTLTPVTSKPVVPTDPMEQYWQKGAWNQSGPEDWYVHPSGDVFAKKQGPAVITFTAPRGKLTWVTNYHDREHYTRYDLSDKGLIVKFVPSFPGINPPKLAIDRKGIHRIQLDWRVDSITVTIDGKVVEIKSPAPGTFAEGKFGFLGKDVQIQNFNLK